MLSHLFSELGIRSFGVCRYDPALADLPSRGRARIPPMSQTVIVCAFPYLTPLPTLSSDSPAVPSTLPSGSLPPLPPDAPLTNLSRYAWVKDYHEVCGAMLERACLALSQTYHGKFVWFCDSSPLREKDYAYRAGLGKRGRNRLLLHPAYGSYCFLGTIVTDLALPEWELTATLLGDCEACGRCVTACPQGCLSPARGALADQTNPFSRCLSHLTQKKGRLTSQEEHAIGQAGIVWGCDLCQACCPHNENLPVTHMTAFCEDVVPTVTLDNLPTLMQTRPFAYRGQAVMQRNLSLCDRFSS